MKKLIKSLTPPLVADKYQYFTNYNDFKNYKKLVAQSANLKDKHKGERCFLLGSGPSIKNENLKSLKNEVVFALNNFYVHDDFKEMMSGDSEKYYMAAPIHPPQTKEEWKNWFLDMEKHVSKDVTMLFGLNRYKENIKFIFDQYDIFKEHKINWFYTGVDTNESYSFNKKHIDVSNMIWNASTVSIYAIIMALYMGFDEIYLLGMDHNYICQTDKTLRFYQSAIHQKDEDKRRMNGASVNQHFFLTTSKIFEQYQLLDDNSNTNIYNTSTSSLLDVFEYRNLNDVLNQ